MADLPTSVALYALTDAGAKLARSLAGAMPGCSIFVHRRLATGRPEARAFDRLAEALRENFTGYAGHVFFCAAGIVVRALAPLLKGKAEDPAVVVVDQKGRFAVSLLSGHLGGANRLARDVALALGGQAVITTATDSAGLPSLEMEALRAGCKVENLPALAGVSGALLHGQKVGLYDPEGWLSKALDPWPGLFKALEVEPLAGDSAGPLVWVGWKKAAHAPSWLVVRPPALAVGMGCNRGTGREELEAMLSGVFARQGLSKASIACLTSVDLKRDEKGLLALAAKLGVGLEFYSREQIKSVDAPNPSEIVERRLGVKSVCEATAMLAANSRRLLVEKQIKGNATLAVALVSST